MQPEDAFTIHAGDGQRRLYSFEGTCRQWARRHPSRWTAGGGFALRLGYGDGEASRADCRISNGTFLCSLIPMAWGGCGRYNVRQRYAKTAKSGSRRACSHSCNDLRLIPNRSANSAWDNSRLSRTSRSRRANSSVCTSRMAPSSLFPAAERFDAGRLPRIIGPPQLSTQSLAAPACQRPSNPLSFLA